MSTKYTPLSIPCDLGESSAKWAIERFTSREPGDSPIRVVPLILTIYASPFEFYVARAIARTLNGPLPPQVNVQIDYALGRDEWYIGDGITASYGSNGA